jgi:hypothetical protein
MKTPREVLLERHQPAERKLDLVRQKVISKALLLATSETRQGAGMRRAWSSGLWTAWEQLVRPSRFIWAGIAAAWLVLAVANAAMKEPSRGFGKNSSMVLQTFVEQRKLLAELLQAESKPAPAPPAPTPSPRSEKSVPEARRLI